MIKEHIINRSTELFLYYGFSKVTADEIAKSAGISKKTLYNYFSGKEEILNAVVNQILLDLESKANIIIQEDDLFPQKLKQVINIVSDALAKLTPQFLEDIQIKLPETWQFLVKQKDEIIKKYFTKLLEQGNETGYLRPEINKEIATIMLMISVEHLFDPNFIQNLPRDVFTNIPRSTNEIFDKIIDVLYHGILTEAAKKEI
ncbi:MAG: TetR/AcrR family transcriptional regulator [Candidatus Cyclobacteriaceae bacterium M3_2C_046]